MSYLLRVQLPDVPGSLGKLATAVGAAGGNIDAIEIVSRGGGHAVDDVFLAADGGVMPDSVVSACQQLEGFTVLWVSRYGAGSNIFLDLEAVQSMTERPEVALETLVDVLPAVFRVDWGMRVRRGPAGYAAVRGSGAAPGDLPGEVRIGTEAVRQRIDDGELLVVAVPVGEDEALVLARRGGPEFLDSEIARLGHLAGLALSIAAR